MRIILDHSMHTISSTRLLEAREKGYTETAELLIEHGIPNNLHQKK
jgi:hypothetical protein